MTAVTDLDALAHEYLDACHNALLQAPGGEIPRRFVNLGTPAWDCCPQLTVHVGSAIEGDTQPVSPALQPGHRIQTTGVVNMITMTATVLRCVPVLKEGSKAWPTPLELDQAASKGNGDLWAIWNYLVHAKNSDQLFLPHERELLILPAVSINPQGGCGGWQVQVAVQLPGFKPDITPGA